MGADIWFSDSGSPTEKEHHEERRRAAAWLWRQFRAAERVRLRNRSLTMKGKGRVNLKTRELVQSRERAPSTHTPPTGSRKALPPDYVLFPPESPPTAGPPRGGFQDHEDPAAILRYSEAARLLPIYSRCLPSTRGPPLSPGRLSRFYSPPSRGRRQDSLT